MQPALEGRWTTVDGRPIYARVFTQGLTGSVPIVLVHGLGVSGRYMVPTALRLIPRHSVYVPDLPGFGKSPKPSRVLDIPELAEALAGWMRAWHLPPSCMVGNSLGCQFIVDLAVRHPDLVRAAVLIGPTMDPRARTLARQIGRGALDMLGEPLRYWPLLTWEYLNAGPIRTIATLRCALADPVADKLEHVQEPTLVIRGSKDPIAPNDWVVEMIKRLPRGRLLVLEGVTHVANYTTPEAVARAVDDFLEEIRTGSFPSPRCQPGTMTGGK